MSIRIRRRRVLEKPPPSWTVEVERSAGQQRSPWEAGPAPYPVCRDEGEFRALAVLLLGKDRARMALA